ncbi:MAG: thiamine-phosphate kinase [Thiolinea sp.]
MSEFDIIKTWFNWPQQDPAITVGNGDDAAVVQLADHEELVVSVDTSIKGVHFPEDTPAHAVGYKSLAVNLSDIAAMGAVPRWFTLALSIPENNAEWLAGFASGLRELADRHNVALIGGDTTRGPLSITIQIMGTLGKGTALRRNHAQSGDLICITGTPGDAAAGLACLQNRLSLPTAEQTHCIQRLNYPTPRVLFGAGINGHAHSCIDVSDGLSADLQHILDQSDKNFRLDHNKLPFSNALAGLPDAEKLAFALTGGDDYELLFTVAPEKLNIIKTIATDTQTPVSVIGEISEHQALTQDTIEPLPKPAGFNHFSRR